nr:immunoglobulin heavy chain junction region [Macaca mulatta]MOV36099.1 immunoglobulin heavy chain junction region [Macaca mulatta]MOV36232.1 immunoglobulin heavy chain junction region [Macaca mulatta]MOV36629.1 immunoglobulin heavy chain junction region [Macaca mulatta]MOV36794.1 immunoglobulin heavy chain junction region [Macaca mulatta]
CTRDVFGSGFDFW